MVLHHRTSSWREDSKSSIQSLQYSTNSLAAFKKLSHLEEADMKNEIYYLLFKKIQFINMFIFLKRKDSFWQKTMLDKLEVMGSLLKGSWFGGPNSSVLNLALSHTVS